MTPDHYFRLQQLLSTPQAATLDMAQLSTELGGVDAELLSELRNAAVAAGVASAGIERVASSNFADVASGMTGQQADASAQAQPPTIGRRGSGALTARRRILRLAAARDAQHVADQRVASELVRGCAV